MTNNKKPNWYTVGFFAYKVGGIDMTTPNKLEIELKKVAPIFTDKTLELLWKWFEAKQEEKLQEQLNCLSNIDFKNIIK